MESDRPFSHTTSAVAMSSTLSFPCPIVCAAMRLAAGHAASQSPRSSSCRPRSRKAPPPACWRRSRHATRLRLGWNVYQPQRIACSTPMSPPARKPRTAREGGDDVDLVEVIRRADGDRCRTSVLEHFLDVVERLLDIESPREGLGLAQVRVADGADLHARQASQHREVCDLSDRARPDHRYANRVAHFGVPGLLSREPAQRYITPLRSDAVETPLDRTARASSVNRQRLAPTSAPIVPFKPAVIELSASCTKVPLMAGPLPCRMWAPSPIPMYAITACPWGRTYCRSTSPVTSLQVMRPRRIVSSADGSITTLLRRCSKRARAAALKSAL